MKANSRVFLSALGIFTLSYFWFLAIYPVAHLYVFQSRDLLRAAAFADGTPVFYGPESTGGGNLFGGLYYLLLALPLKLGLGLKGVWHLLTFFTAAATSLLWIFLRRFSQTGAWLAAGIFAVSAYTVSSIGQFFNASYVYPSTVLAFFSLALAFKSDFPRRSGAWFFFCFLIGCAIQIHFSLILFLLIGIFLEVSARRFGLLPLKSSTFCLGLTLFALPLLPFFCWWIAVLLGHPFGFPAPESAGRIVEALPSIAYLLKPFLEHLPNHSLDKILGQLLYVLPFPAVTLILMWMLGWTRFETDESKSLRTVALLGAVFGLPLMIYCFINPIGYRYISVFFLGVTLLGALIFDQIKTSKEWRLYIGTTVAQLILISAYAFSFAEQSPELLSKIVFTYTIALTFWILFWIEAKPNQQRLSAVFLTFAVGAAQVMVLSEHPIFKFDHLNMLQNRILADTIFQNTGWNVDQARQRIFFINGHKEEDFVYFYSHASFASPPPAPGHSIDGFFVTIDPALLNENDPSRLSQWIQNQPVQKDLREGLAHNELKLSAPIETSDRHLKIIPYTVTDLEHLPPHFQDVGYPYEPIPEDVLFRQLTTVSGVKTLGLNHLLFFWNECPSPQVHCTGAAEIEMAKSNDRLNLSVRVLGDSMSQPSEWLIPEWTQSWINPYIEIRCGGENERALLASSIGFNAVYSAALGGIFIVNNSFLAPFERKLSFPCHGPLQEISVGRDGAVIDDNFAGFHLPAQKLTQSFKTLPQKSE